MSDHVFQEKLNYHLLDSFVKQTSTVISGHFLVALINVGLFWSKINSSFIFAWALFLLFTSAVRWWLKARYERNQRQHSPDYWRTLFALSSLLLGLVWLTWSLYVGAAIEFGGVGLSIIVITAAGLVSGAVASTSSSPYSFILFAVPILLPLSVVLLFDEDTEIRGIGVLMILFFVIILRQLLRIHEVLKESIINSLELEKSKEQTEMLARELYQLSTTDALTSVTNRRGFDEALESEWSRARRLKAPISLLMVDVDFFKTFNDTLGHIAGDECLQRVASALPGYVRRAGETIARYGGEEFAILLPNTTSGEAIEIAENIREGIMKLDVKHPASDVADRITISIGVHSVTPGQLEDSQQLIERADQALYQAKEAGRNRVHVAR